MTFTALPSLLAVPELQSIHGAVYTGVALASTTAKAATIFECPAAGTLTDVMFRTHSPFTSPADISVRMETVNPADGYPSGALIGPGADAVVPSPAASTPYFPAFNTGQTVTLGQRMALVLSCPSGSPSLNIARVTVTQSIGLPYSVTATVGAYSKTASLNFIMAVKISGVWYTPFGLIGAPTLNTLSVTSTGTPNERGNLFSLPLGVRIMGVWVNPGTDSTAVTCDVFLRDASNTVLASVTYISAMQVSQPMFIMFPSPVDLPANTDARVTMKTTSAAGKNYRTTDVTSATYISALPGKGLFKRTTRKDTGAWTDVNTGVETLGLLISHIDLGGAASGRKVKVGGTWVAA